MNSRVVAPALVRAYELHGGRLASHDVETAARVAGIKTDSVRRRVRRHFKRLESGWSLAAALEAGAVGRIRDAADAIAAYERLIALQLAPPTFRMFRRLFIDSGAFPELSALVARDCVVWEAADIGQGPRACVVCVAERRSR